MRSLSTLARSTVAALLLAGCTLVLAACAAVTTTTTTTEVALRPSAHASHPTKRGQGSSSGQQDGRQRRTPGKPPHLRAAHGTREKKLVSALRRALKGSGPHTGTMVSDLTSDTLLYSHKQGQLRAPASIEKIYTSVALLDLLGANTRLRTRVYGTGTLGKHGVWHGDLYLKGGGDPTFGDGYWNKVAEDGYGSTAAGLVGQLQARGIRRVTGRLYADASLFDHALGGPATHDKPDTPDYEGQLSALVYDHGMTADHLGPAPFAAHELALTMKARNIIVKPARKTRKTPKSARLLATVYSPPLRVMVRLMDVPSDDLFADLFAKQLGARLFGRGSLAAGSIEIRQLLAARYGIKPLVFDGSGLDRSDRTSPAEVVSLLEQVQGTKVGRELQAALPVVGRQGTVAPLGIHTYAAGHCVAKTGTLNNVTNLAGYCNARHGQRLTFAIFIDGPENWTALAALSKAVTAIANY